MKNIAIIPARSGSKGLKDKNIKELNGKPLIAYAIEAAQKSGLYDMIFLSTDSERYAEIGRRYGASVPFLRSEELSTDKAGSWDVVKDVLSKLEDRDQIFDTITLLQPTSPLRTEKHLQEAMELMKTKSANAIISVCETDHSPLWEHELQEDGNMKMFNNKRIANIPRQELPTFYRVNGAIYLLNVNYLRNTENIYDDRCYAYVMDKRLSIDIDDEYDFKLAEFLLSET